MGAAFGYLTSGRISRAFYALAMILVMGSYAYLTIKLGVDKGLRSELAAFVPLTAAALIARLVLSAMRWRAIGLPAWPAALASTAVATLSPLVLEPTLATLVAIGVLSAECLLPSKSLQRTA